MRYICGRFQVNATLYAANTLPGITGLCEGVDGHPEAGVLPHQPGRVLLGEEGVHEDEGHVGVIGPVQVLNLLHSQVQGGQVVSHGDCAGRPAVNRCKKMPSRMDLAPWC